MSRRRSNSSTSCLSVTGEFICSLIFGLGAYVTMIGNDVARMDVRASVTSDEGGACSAEPAISGIFSGMAGAIAIGLGGFVAVCSLSTISPAHFNPALTVSAIATGKVSPSSGLFYILSQIAGFVLASLIAAGISSPIDERGLFGRLGIVIGPPISDSDDIPRIISALFTEFILTFIFTFVVFSVAINEFKSDDAEDSNFELGSQNQRKSDSADKLRASAAVGTAISFLIFVGSRVSGAFFNPGLVLPPIVFDLHGSAMCILYMLVQILGGIFGGFVQFVMATKFSCAD